MSDEYGDQIIDGNGDIAAQVEDIQQQAKASFSLRDRLKRGVKQRRRKVPVFLDLDAADRYATAKAEADGLIRAAERSGIKEDVRTQLLDAHNAKLDELEAVRAEMLEETLVIHLVSLPNEIIKAVNAKARLELKAAAKGRPITDEESQELGHTVALRTLAMGIEKIVESDGSERREITEDDCAALEDILGATQWDNLYTTFESMLFTQEAIDAATSESGF